MTNQVRNSPSFVPVVPVKGPDHLILGFARDPNRPERFIAVGGQRVDVALLTEDGGTTWEALTSPGKGLRGAWLDGDVLWVCGEYGFLAVSRDGGLTFTTIDTGAGGCLFGVAVDEQGVVWCCGDGGFVIASTDDGKTFKRVKGAGVSLSRMFRAPWGILVPTDKPGDLLHLTSPKRKPNLQRVGIGAGGDLMTATVTPRGTTVVVGAGGVCFRSEDQGQTFTRIDSGTTTLLCGVCATDDGRVFAVGEKGTVLLSVDDARTFQPVTTGLTMTLWCCAAIGDDVYVGGQGGLIAKLVDVDVALAGVTAPTVRRDLVPGVIVDDALRAMVRPWRGAPPALFIAPPPLPTRDEAWREVRSLLWATDRYRTALTAKDAAIWEMAIGPSATDRALADRIVDEAARPITTDDALALAQLVFRDVLRGPLMERLAAAVADLLVVNVGVVDAVNAALRAMPKELPYTGVAMFGRLRERAVLATDEDYQALRKTVPGVVDEEIAAQPKRTARAVDLLCAASFVLPPPQKSAHPDDDVEQTLLTRAASHIGRFGDSDTAHASLLASGDADVLQRFLSKNEGRHELFAGAPAPYLATALVRGEGLVRQLLPKLRPRYDSNVEIWADLMARVDDGQALERLLDALRDKPAPAIDAAFAWRASLDPDTAAALLARLPDDERAARRGLLVPRATPTALGNDALLRRLGTPSTWTPPTPLPAAPLTVPEGLDLPVSFDFQDDERGNRPYDGHWRFQPRSDAPADTPIRTLSDDDVEAYLAHRERWQLPTPAHLYVLLPTAVHPRLLALGTARSPSDRSAWRAAVVKGGEAVLPALRAYLHSDADLEARLEALAPIGDVASIIPVVEGFIGKKNKALARAWLLRHRRHAIAGALSLIVIDTISAPLRDGAARILRFLDGLGLRDAIVRQAGAHSADLVTRVQSLLDDDPLLQPGAKRPTLPGWLKPASLPPLIDVATGAPRDTDAQMALLERLAVSNVDELHPALRAATRTTTTASLADFARALFTGWLEHGADPKQVWCMLAVGVFGDDALVRTLGSLVKVWPGESAAARAQQGLDVLVVHGGDVALLQVSLLAEKSKFAALKKGAAERIAAIAERRGLTRDELADRLVPTFDLDDEAGGVLDFGARRFTVTFDEHLTPRVKDNTGTVLKDLPKPNKSDDAALAKAAKARLSGLKKDVKAVADLLLRRLERAMLEGRSIDGDVFQTCYLEHPLSFHVARRLVWEARDATGASLGRFRIAEDRSFADVEDNAWQPPRSEGRGIGEGVRFVVVHPLSLDDSELSAWSTLFGDYELLQPFAQLGRARHRVDDDERDEKALTRFRGRSLSAPKLVFGLEGRGWRREEAGDGGGFQSHDRELAGVCATISYDGAVAMGFIEESELLTIDDVTFATTRPLTVDDGTGPRAVPAGRSLVLADVPPALFAEVIADLEALLS